MERPADLESDVAAAVERCLQLIEIIQQKTATAVADRSGSVKALRESAQRALASTRFGQTTPANELLRAKKHVVLTLDKSRGPIADGLTALLDVAMSVAVRDAVQDADIARKANKAKSESGTGMPIEAQRFFQWMTELGVSPSMFDLETQAEREVHAHLFLQKNDDYRHKVKTGIWMEMWRSGFVDFPVAGLTEDEATAVHISRRGDAEEGLMAKRFLEDVAGRELAISIPLALALFHNFRAKQQSRGVRLTGEALDVADVERDHEFILTALGLSGDDGTRAWAVRKHILHPQMAEFERRRAVERDEQQALEDLYLPVARQWMSRRAAWRAAYKDRQRSSGVVDCEREDVVDIEMLIDFDRESDSDGPLSGGTSELAIAVGHSDGEGSIGPGENDLTLENDRHVYRAAIDFSDDAECRELARALARHPRYRNRLREKGADVPEPPSPDDTGKSDGTQPVPLSQTTSTNIGISAAAPVNLTRAERARRMKGEQ